MQRNGSMILFMAIVFVVGGLSLTGFARIVADHGAFVVRSIDKSSNENIPVTTASEEARKEFLQGRDLAERLLFQDSIQHFDKAISLDLNFALAELSRANVSPTAKEFFAHLKKGGEPCR